MVATEKNEKSEEVQVATLLNQLGHEGQELFKTFDMTDENRKKIKEVKKRRCDENKKRGKYKLNEECLKQNEGRKTKKLRIKI